MWIRAFGIRHSIATADSKTFDQYSTLQALSPKTRNLKKPQEMAQTKMASENYEFIIEKISSNQPSLDPQQPSSSLHTSLYHILNHFYLVKELPTTADQHIRTRDELDREKREKLFSLLEWEASGKNRDFYSLLFTPPDPNDDSKDGDGVAINAPCGYIFKAQDAVYRCMYVSFLVVLNSK